MSHKNDSVVCNLKTPKRVLHFSDGVLEEDDIEEEIDPNFSKNEDSIESKQIVSKNWPMVSVVVNNMFWLGSEALKVCDYLGEGLADFFGITSPKYEYEIEEYNRRVEEQKRRHSKISTEFKGWTQSDGSNTEVNFNDVKSVHKPNGSEPKECIHQTRGEP